LNINQDYNISVIIPTWNRALLLKRAIISVLNQTISPLEILVCDDGSTDESEALVRSITDERVKWLAGSRGGRPAIPRNHGILESKGEWLAFLDSDDEWLPDKLEKQMELVKMSGCKAACSNAFRFIPDRGIDGEYLTWQKEQIFFDDLLRVNQVICSSCMIHRSLIDDIQGFPEETGMIEDYALWLRVATQTNFAYVNKPLVIYRDDAKNSVRSMVETDVWIQRKIVLRDFLNWAKRKKINLIYILKGYIKYYKVMQHIKKQL
jgi:teichuronic acid biosynthesis glycosyltransferase TuaG